MAESNAPLSDNELCQTFKTVKLLVWSNANITSFVGVLKHLEEHGPIHLNHGDWVYKLSVTLRCLVASSAAKNLEFPVCVYKGILLRYLNNHLSCKISCYMFSFLPTNYIFFIIQIAVHLLCQVACVHILKMNQHFFTTVAWEPCKWILKG